MMTIEAVKEVLSHITYKPNTKLDVWDDLSPVGLTVVMYMDDVVDTYHPERKTTFFHYARIPQRLLEHFTPQDFTRWLFKALIMSAERHEAEEFFKIDGKMVTDPHAGER